MVTLDDSLVNCKNKDNEYYLDNRTSNALNHADIYTVMDLVNFCWVHDSKNSLAWIRGLWKNWVSKTQELLVFLESEWFLKESIESTISEINIGIDKNIQVSSLIHLSKSTPSGGGPTSALPL